MTNNQFPMTTRARPPGGTDPPRRVSGSLNVPQKDLEMYHVIIHCRDEPQQRELFERLRREGLRWRLTVL